MVSYTNEDAKDIHCYGKLREALQDYELMEGIKALPDDMILEIKAYVISPYKFMAEFKLYKCPKFTIFDGELHRAFFREEVNHQGEIEMVREKVEEYEYSGYRRFNKFLRIRKLNGDNGRFVIRRLVRDRQIMNECLDIRQYNKQYENRQVLKNLQIKGRTKLIHEKTTDIITAILKGS